MEHAHAFGLIMDRWKQERPLICCVDDHRMHVVGIPSAARVGCIPMSTKKIHTLKGSKWEKKSKNNTQ